MSEELTPKEREQIATILSRRANEVSMFRSGTDRGALDRHAELPSSVDYALEREMNRLRRLAERVKPAKPEDDDEEP